MKEELKAPVYDHFEGLNALRFFATIPVILTHIQANQIRMDLPVLPDWPVFSKGATGVSFFFVLSGFLITYRLMRERKLTGSINIRQFYIRRILRIWPLYFLVIVLGLLIYWVVFPSMGIPFQLDYTLREAIIFYLFFGANYLTSMYRMGAMLNVTWSIAIEEQFYLIWAPLVKFASRHLTWIIPVVVFGLTIVDILNYWNYFHLSLGWQRFVDSLQFHYLLIGAWFARLLFRDPDKLLSTWVFRIYWVQWLPMVYLMFSLFVIPELKGWEPWLILPNALAFGWLMITVSVNKRRLFAMKNRVLNYFGSVSYGIYMYHAFCIYFISFVFTKLNFALPPVQFHLLYFFAVMGLTLFISALSFRYFELPIQNWRKARV